jgi:hypothetical protein
MGVQDHQLGARFEILLLAAECPFVHVNGDEDCGIDETKN